MEKETRAALAARLKTIGEYRDYLKLAHRASLTLPEDQAQELHAKLGRVAEILAWEIEELRKFNLEHAVKH
ncbi:MAG: hypothetical protein Hals2KO_02550 [Halioglobus sp.]